MVCPPNSNDPKNNSTRPPRDFDSTAPGSEAEKTSLLKPDQETLNKELQKAKEQDACLIIIRGTPQGHRFFLTQNEMTVGRDDNADITINDQSISRKHAKLLKSDGRVFISDLGSSNGSFVNNKKIAPNTPTELFKEDMIKLGNSILKFLPAGEIEILFYHHMASEAHTDGLTKIYNRRYLEEALQAEFKRSKALHTDLCVLFFDLDHFKKVNDTYGHDAGDYVLVEFCNIVRSMVRPKDVFARYGGEEFVLLLTNTPAKIATDMAERIRASVEGHAFIYKGKRIPVTTSLGLAETRADIESAGTLIKSADQALYHAKQSGRNRLHIAT